MTSTRIAAAALAFGLVAAAPAAQAQWGGPHVHTYGGHHYAHPHHGYVHPKILRKQAQLQWRLQQKYGIAPGYHGHHYGYRPGWGSGHGGLHRRDGWGGPYVVHRPRHHYGW